MEFFRDAPLGAVILVVVGAFLEFVLATFLHLKLARAHQKREQEPVIAEAPVMVREDDGARTLLLVRIAGWTCLIAGFAWYILD